MVRWAIVPRFRRVEWSEPGIEGHAPLLKPTELGARLDYPVDPRNIHVTREEPKMAGTSFDRRFDRWMQDPEFAESYRLHRPRIDAIDTLMRGLDDERERRKMTKADLARRIEAEPAAVRRLFTESQPNPQIGRLVDIAHELGFEITLQRRRRKTAPRSSAIAASC